MTYCERDCGDLSVFTRGACPCHEQEYAAIGTKSTETNQKTGSGVRVTRERPGATEGDEVSEIESDHLSAKYWRMLQTERRQVQNQKRTIEAQRSMIERQSETIERIRAMSAEARRAMAELGHPEAAVVSARLIDEVTS